MSEKRFSGDNNSILILRQMSEELSELYFAVVFFMMQIESIPTDRKVGLDCWSRPDRCGGSWS